MGWKAKRYDVAREMDRLSAGEKAKVINEVNETYMIIKELNDSTQRLV